MTRVVLITGASSGIGYAAALAFAREGTHVAAVARRVERLEALAAAVQALPAPHGEILTIAANVQDGAAMQAAVQQTVERFGRLDILVANAGLGHRGSVADADWSDLETLLRTNIDGVLHSVRAAVPALRQTGSGHIITISSIVYNLVSPYAATYAASKAFVSSLAKSLRMELEPDHIQVTDFLVGRTATEFNDNRLGAGKRAKQDLPVMSADQVAEAIVRATHQHQHTVTLRLFDRLIVWGNIFIPGIMGRMAKRQYR
ncbi:MAG TPA: SDR family NAD(P)-dependent oxidoreductase [Phototrophicaceae bacterium]|nr:SDR family NAD(P)-dependent oxidoreductase [Phototrophicaceae bacterium]